MHTAVLTTTGEMYSWGVNDEGALGRYTEGAAWAAHAALAAREPGDTYTPGLVTMPAGAPRVARLSAGDSHTVALTRRGSVYGWGTFRDNKGVWAFSRLTEIAVRARACLSELCAFEQTPAVHRLRRARPRALTSAV
jgi:regulator of chromosome condensation